MNRYWKLFNLILALALVACAGQDQSNQDETEEVVEVEMEAPTDDAEMPSESGFQLDMIIANNIAAPIKLMTDMKLAGVKHYQEDAVNPTDKLEHYSTAEQKAIIFGVYGADLSYNSLYERNQEMADDMIAIRSLSQDLGFTHLFDQEAFETFDRIKGHADSVKAFVFEKYDEADEYLRENEQIKLSALMLTGGLVESLHLMSAQMHTEDVNAEAYEIFLSQKHTLKSLLDLYIALENDGIPLEQKADVEMLHQKFDEFDDIDKFSKENRKALRAAIEEVRARMV